MDTEVLKGSVLVSEIYFEMQNKVDEVMNG